jgi:hypothetical protein
MTSALRRVRRRPGRYPAAMIIALLLIVLGGTVAWVAITRLATGGWPSFVETGSGWLSGQSWGSPWLLGAAVIIGVLGLILVVLAIKPGRHHSVVLDQAPAEQVEDSATILSYRGLARLAAIHTRQLDGADDVRATVGSRKVRIDVRGPRTDQAELRRSVAESVTGRLADLKLQPLPRVVVRSRHREVN